MASGFFRIVSLALLFLAGCSNFYPRVELPPNAKLVFYRGEDVTLNSSWQSPSNGCLYFYRENKRRVVAVLPVHAGRSPSIQVNEYERVYFVPDPPAAGTQPAK